MPISQSPITRPLAFAAASLAPIALHAQSFEARLRPVDPIQSDVFGYDLAFDGTTVLGGAPFGTHSGFSQPGRAYVFHMVGGQWVQQQKLLPSVLQTNARFGNHVAIDGDVLAVSASGEDTTVENAGAVYVFEQAGGVWSEVVRLSPGTEPFTTFGSAIEISGDTLMVGAWGDTAAGAQYAGRVYVYERIAGVWTHVDTLETDNPLFDDNFGAAISIDGDTAMIGAIDVDVSGIPNAGAVYVFEKGPSGWKQTARLIAPEPTAESLFGGCLALEGDTVVIGAEDGDTAHIFERSGGVWSQTVQFSGSGDFGVDVDLEGDTILIGAYLNNIVHVYRRSAGVWVFDTTMASPDPGGLYGWRLDLAGDRAAVAGPFFQTNRGAVYMMQGLSTCYPDCDGNTAIDVFDFLCFQDAFVMGDPYADCDENTTLDIFDFLCFQDAFTAGCS
jgi:hypothetical protein